MFYEHQPVMLKEVLYYLNPCPGESFIDGTLGGAGYTLALAERVGTNGKIVSFDLDDLAIKHAQQIISSQNLNNIVLFQDNFKNLVSVLRDNFPDDKFDGLVLDLGLSSAQLVDEERGFSFKGEHPLNMAFGSDSPQRTTEIINHYLVADLTRIFKDYGEEPQAARLAQAIDQARRVQPLNTTSELVKVIEQVIPGRQFSRIHPATRIFQALRMETNGELNNLSDILNTVREILKPNGRLVIVSFHSGEDRIVKQFLKGNSDWQILTKRPLVATANELNTNPRARSAKLRAAKLI